jgi:glycosyltransferase involved in cell wall biosynthesis
MSVKTLAEKFNDLGFQVGVITLGKDNKMFKLNGIMIWRLKIENYFWPFEDKKRSNFKKLFWHIRDSYNSLYKNKIQQIFETFKPDIVHTNNLAGLSVYVWNLAKKHDIKIVHTLRDYYLECPKTNKFKNNRPCEKQCLDCYALSINKKKASQKVDAVIGISNYILSEHIKLGYFKNAKKRIIVNGFEINVSKLSPIIFNDKSYLKFGFIGQINKAKGIETLLRSLSTYKNHNNWKLLVAGNINRDYQDELQQILPNDKINFLGYTKQSVFLKKINVLIVPSKWEEPFGRVVLEGLINSIVVLGSDKGGIKEILSNNKRFTFDPTEKRMNYLFGDIINSPSKLNLFKHDISHINQFSIDRTANEYKELFFNLTGY